MSQLRNCQRQSAVQCVAIDDAFALIDPVGSRVVVVNAAAAWIWTRLGTDTAIPAADAPAITAFVDELVARGLAAPASAKERRLSVAPAGRLGPPPSILSQTPLQVAANNSAPFSDPFSEGL